MLTALVLICSLAATPDLSDCTRANATAVMRLPAEFASPVTCLMHGQAYLVQTSIGEELGEKRSREDRLCAQRNRPCVDSDTRGEVAAGVS